MAEVDMTRHFPNSFPDYDPAKPDHRILSGSGLNPGLSPAFVASLRRHRNELLMKHFQEYSRVRDEDQSVYTGLTCLTCLTSLV